jgi:hypothetical protein
MASRELNILVAAKGALKAARDIGTVDSKVKGLSASAGRIGKGLALGGAALAGGGILLLQRNVDAGIASLKELEQVENATNAVIESTGGKAGVTAAQVRKLAEAQENLTTVDDKVVQAGQNMLLTFTGIGSDVFPIATEAMVNMAVAMNNGSAEGVDLKSTAIQLGKALNDPIKGVTALRKVGVALTEQQQKDIKSLVKQGKMREAQLIILKELEVEFGKAGEAAGQGAAATQRRFDDAVEGAQQALATGLLPVIEEVQKEMTGLLADEGNLSAIKGFGQGLAGAFREGIAFAKQIPWASIADAMKLAGTGAKAALDLFTGLPPWVQTAVVTGWGLNKLTGGAVGGIVSSLGSGLIKGVLGMNAGVVNINAGVVNGGGGPGGVPVPGGGKFNPLSLIPLVAVAGIELAIADAIKGPFREALGLKTDEQGRTIPKTEQVGPVTLRIGESGGMERDRLMREAQSRTSVASTAAGADRWRTAGPGASATRAALEGVRASERTERTLSGPVVRELAAVQRIAASTAPSQKSAEAHLAQIKALQQTEAGRASGDQAALRSMLAQLNATISRGFNVNVNTSASDNAKADAKRRRTVKAHGPRNVMEHG